MSLQSSTLIDLLPAVYRIKDRNGALQALLEVLTEQALVVARDVDRLYDDWFIETCDPWAVPYIGDLLGVRVLTPVEAPGDPVAPVPARALGSRGYVANTMAYRRRKGTLAVIEQLALDVTGWAAHAVEGFGLLGTTQYLNHVRTANLRTPDLRRAGIDTVVDSPFDRTGHTADVRSISPSRSGARAGIHNIPNVALHLWRLQSYRVLGAAPRPTGTGTATFDPLGGDVPQFDAPETEGDITHLSTERDVPDPLRRLALAAELEVRRQAIVDGMPHQPRWFDDDPPVRVLARTGVAPAPFVAVAPERLAICDLSTWQRPARTRSYKRAADGANVDMTIDVAIDPQLGRLAFPAGFEPNAVRVDYAYGFSADIGGGPYDRRAALDRWLGSTAGIGFHVGVTSHPEIVASASESALLVATLHDAIARWKTHSNGVPNAFGLITIMDSGSYDENLTGDATVTVPQGARLAIVAADWPDLLPMGAQGGTERRRPGLIAADAPLRPHLRGSMSVRGTAGASSASPGQLVISGLLVERGISVLAGSLGELAILDSTLPPATAPLTVNESAAAGQRNRMLRVAAARSILGELSLPSSIGSFEARDCIVDAGEARAIDAAGANVALTRCTIFGETRARTVEISDCIHTKGVRATMLQQGCVRYSSLPEYPESLAPRRYRCLPDMGIEGLKDPALIARRRAELRPAFTSVRYGDPGYAQLATACPSEIQTGASDDSAMGAFGALREAQRIANLRTCLDEYLPFGLEAGIFFAT
jgi:hypothetical protein